jgi:hypothetical protein
MIPASLVNQKPAHPADPETPGDFAADSSADVGGLLLFLVVRCLVKQPLPSGELT